MRRRVNVLGRVVLLSVWLVVAGAAVPIDVRGDEGAAVETVGPGTVNWTTGMITAVGLGAPPENAANKAQARAMAERAAFSVAVRNLLEVVKGIQVDSATLVENMVVSNDIVKTRVTGLVKGAQALKKDVQPDGGVEVTVGVPLTGELVDIVIPKEFGRKAPAPVAAKPVPAAPAPKAPDAPAVPPPAAPPAAKPAAPASAAAAGDGYTGLLVDARGLGLKPALAPKLVDEQGKELYASEVLDRNQAVQMGVAGYAKDLVAGSRNPRVTDNPLVVKALRATGNKATDIVLGADSVKAIQQSEPSAHFLQRARVVVIYD
jgi:hypothetical protein